MLVITQTLLTTSDSQIKLITIIPIIISAISLLISLIIVLRTWLVERFNLDFEMIKWFGINDEYHPIFIWLYITNHSKLPCSVLEVKIHNKSNGQIVEGVGTGKGKLISTTRIAGHESKDNFSLDYPVRIEPYDSVGGYFHVVSKSRFYEYEDQTIQITIRTSRGSIAKNIFMDYGKNIYRVWQYRNPNITVKINKRSDGSTINYIVDKDIN